MTYKIHCPDCPGFLRVLNSEELLEMFPTSRASEFARHPEMSKTQYWIHPRTFEMHERWGKPKRVGLYCDKCGHFHDIDERGLVESKYNRKVVKIGVKKIKGYGTYHYNK